MTTNSPPLALVVGILLILASAIGMGAIADFLSKSVITGFVIGLAISIIVSQLPKIFGVPGGEGSNVQQLVQLAQNIVADRINWWTLAVGAGSLAQNLGKHHAPLCPRAVSAVLW